MLENKKAEQSYLVIYQAQFARKSRGTKRKVMLCLVADRSCRETERMNSMIKMPKTNSKREVWTRPDLLLFLIYKKKKHTVAFFILYLLQNSETRSQ